MTLEELKHFLCTGKLKFQESNGKRHSHYRPAISGQPISLPTIVCVSHGRGEVPPANIKGVATALGLNTRELQTSESCKIGRDCVLLMLSCEMLQFSLRRQMQMQLHGQPDPQLANAGIKAMVVSVEILIAHVKENLEKKTVKWDSEERKALERITPKIEALRDEPLLKDVAVSLLKVIR